MDLSHEAQLLVEQDLKRLRRGYTCNLHRLNRWVAHLNEGACHEDLNDVGELLLRDSLVGSGTRWDSVLGAKVTYDEITNTLRANVMSLIEEYFASMGTGARQRPAHSVWQDRHRAAFNPAAEPGRGTAGNAEGGSGFRVGVSGSNQERPYRTVFRQEAAHEGL